MKIYDIGCGHLGNGITYWNRAEEEHGDFKKVAHIGYDRKVSIYDKELPREIKREIRRFARFGNMPVSATQPNMMVLKEL